MPQTIQQVIDTIIANIPGAPYAKTVDVLKLGDPQQQVTGIAVTFLATYSVIEQAIAQNANLIIAHEPLFYNHLDEVAWLASNSVYQAKRHLLQDHHIAVWRFHDYLHSLRPDPTTIGILRALNWNQYVLADKPILCQLPPRTLRALVGEIKSALRVNSVRVVGDLDMECRTVGIAVGAPGGGAHIRDLDSTNMDVLLCGEIHEWETSEYVRDAMQLGQHKAIVVFGHAPSEEPGMQEIIPWLQSRLPQEKITYIP